jgi:glycerophosphoryl diester phosphodiesterase
VVTWSAAGKATASVLVKDAHAAGLVVHPYTARSDALPKHCPSMAALHAALFREAKADGVFTDFPDRTKAWIDAGR